MKESYARREKRQPIPKRVSGDGSATAALSIRFSFVCPFGRAIGFGARERSERVTVRRQPHRQLRRRLVYKPSARLTAILIFAANLRHRKVVPLLQKSMLIVLETVLILLHILMQSAKI